MIQLKAVQNTEPLAPCEYVFTSKPISVEMSSKLIISVTVASKCKKKIKNCFTDYLSFFFF